MSNLLTVKGLIIRSVDMKESDRLITLFTEEMGVVSAIAKGARSLRSRYMSSTMLFCYGSYVLYKKGDYYWIREAELHESFFHLRDEIERLALAGYLCDVLSFVATEEAERDLLRLALNSLYAIAKGSYPLDKIKAAFEIRAATILGFMPDVTACRTCGAKEGDFFLDILSGSLDCRDCHVHRPASWEDDSHGESRPIALLSESARIAFTYCIFAPLERLLSFALGEDDMHLFCHAAEEYLVHQLERSFKTLDFYKEVSR